MSSTQKKSYLSRCFKWGINLFILVIILVIGAWFWFMRPIDPVVLDAAELASVDQKLDPIVDDLMEGNVPQGQFISITQRELNGYLNHHSEWGQKLKFFLQPDDLIVEANVTLPEDAPAMAGQEVRLDIGCLVKSVDGELVIEVTSIKALGTHYPEQYLQDYMHRNVVPDISEALKLDLNLKSIASVSLKEELVEIEFMPQ